MILPWLTITAFLPGWVLTQKHDLTELGVYSGTLQEVYTPQKERYYNCRGTVYIQDLHHIVITKFTFQPSFSHPENITLWIGPLTPRQGSDYSPLFPSINGFYVKPEKIQVYAKKDNDFNWPYILAKTPTTKQIASITAVKEQEDEEIAEAEPTPQTEPVINRAKRQLSGTAHYVYGGPPPPPLYPVEPSPEIFYRGSWDTSPILSSLSGNGYGIPLSGHSSNSAGNLLSPPVQPQVVSPLGTARNLLKNLFGAAGSLNVFDGPSQTQSFQQPNYYQPPVAYNPEPVNPIGNLVRGLFGGNPVTVPPPPQDPSLIETLLNLIPQMSDSQPQPPQYQPQPEPKPEPIVVVTEIIPIPTIRVTSPLPTLPSTKDSTTTTILKSPTTQTTTTKTTTIRTTTLSSNGELGFRHDKRLKGEPRVRLIVDGGVVDVPASSFLDKNSRPGAITISNQPESISPNLPTTSTLKPTVVIPEPEPSPTTRKPIKIHSSIDVSLQSNATVAIVEDPGKEEEIVIEEETIEPRVIEIEPLDWHAGFHPIRLTLPPQITTRDINWVSVWDHTNQDSIASVLIPQGPGFRIPQSATFRGLKPALPFKEVNSSSVEVLDSKTIIIHDFYFEGDAPGAWFMVGKDLLPHPGGHIVPIYSKKTDTYDCDFLDVHEFKDVVLKLPGDVVVQDVFWLSVFCVPYAISFSHIYLPFADLSVPPVLDDAIVPQCLFEAPDSV